MSKRASRRLGVGLLAAGLLLPVVLLAQTFSYTGPSVVIPDSPSAGVDVLLPVAGLAGTIADIDFQLDPIAGAACTNATNSAGASIAHTWIGDLIVTITQPGGGTSVTVIDKPGTTVPGGLGCSQNNFCTVLLDDEAGGGTVESQCGSGAIAGNFTPNNPLSAFDGLAAATANGNWTVHVTDTAGGDTGSIRAFSLIFTMAGGGCSLTCPADQNVSTAAGTCSATVNYPQPTPTGQCGQVICTPASGSLFPLGQTQVDCVEQIVGVTEGLGASCAFNVTVADNEPPVVGVPNPVVGNDPGLCSADVLFVVAVGDNCPGVGPVNCVPPGPTYPVGVTPVNCSVTDAAGNVGNGAGSVTVNDVEAPVITCPADVEEDLPPGTTEGVVNYDPPGVTDNCSATYDCQPPSGDIFQSGTTPVVCVATDGASNSDTCQFNVILNEVSILEIPTMSRLGLAALALLLAGAAILVFRRNG